MHDAPSRPLRERPTDVRQSLLLAVLTLCVGLLSASCGGGGAGAPGGGNETGSAGIPLEGLLLDGEGLPVDGALVVMDNDAETAVVTGPDGIFSFAVSSGVRTYTVHYDGVLLLTDSKFVSSKQSKVDLGGIQVLTSVRGRAIDGAGAPVAGALVEVTGTLDKTTVTEDDGTFLLQVATGSYTLTPSWQGYEAGEVDFDAELPVAAELGDMQVLNELRGRFLDGFLQPITDAVVLVKTAPDMQAMTDETGYFAVQAPAGTHEMLVTHEGMLLAVQQITVTGPAPTVLGDQQVLVHVTGRVIGDDLAGVAGAEIVVDTAPMTLETTAADGTFGVDLPLEDLTLCVRLNGIIVESELLTVGAWTSIGVVGLDEIPVFPMADVDGDTLGNEFESEGWTILVDSVGQGQADPRHVTSDPFDPDGDGDGLSDDEEFAYKTDPDRADTDGDLLDDRVEIFQYLSQPMLVDTDRDALPLGPNGEPDTTAVPYTLFFDGHEVAYLRTSPTLDDTDGDGVRDSDEILEGGTSALIADLPKIAVEVFGEPVLGFVGDEALMVETIQTSVANDASASTQTNEFNFKTEGSLETEVKAEAGAGFPGGYSASIEAEATLKAAVYSDYSYHTTSSATTDLKNAVEQMQSSSQEYTAGKIEAAIEVRNESDLTIRYSDLEIIVFQLDPSLGVAGLKPLGKLNAPVSAAGSGGGDVLLGPQSSVTVLRENTELDLLRVRDYMVNPTGLYFRIGDFSLFQLDEDGNVVQDYDVVAQNVVERTGMISIDWGDGTTEQHAIATNVDRDVDGTPMGLRMADALAVLDLSFETFESMTEPSSPSLPSANGKHLLETLDGVTTTGVSGGPAERYWLVQGPGAVDEQSHTVVDFPEIRIKPGEAYYLQYVTDEDGDGLTSQQELVFGTSDESDDSDGDGAGDYQEIVQGWTVEYDKGSALACGLTELQVDILGYQVRSNPRFADIDGDGLLDGDEMAPPAPKLPTDPTLPDTDYDGVTDKFDDVSEPCGVVGPPLDDNLIVHLTLSEASYDDATTPRLLDASGFENHAGVRGTSAVVDDLGPKGTDVQNSTGLQWVDGSLGQDKAALLFRNESTWWEEFCFPPFGSCKLWYVDPCDDDAVLEILRDDSAEAATNPPRMEAINPDQGWTWMVRFDMEDAQGYPDEEIPSSCWWKWTGSDKTGHIASQPGFAFLKALVSDFECTITDSLGDDHTVQGTGVTGWNVVVVRVKGLLGNQTEVAMWINGTKADDLVIPEFLQNPSPAGSTDAAPLWLGTWDYDTVMSPQANWALPKGKEALNGAIDDFRVYDTPLPEAEILEL